MKRETWLVVLFVVTGELAVAGILVWRAGSGTRTWWTVRFRGDVSAYIEVEKGVLYVQRIEEVNQRSGSGAYYWPPRPTDFQSPRTYWVYAIPWYDGELLNLGGWKLRLDGFRLPLWWCFVPFCAAAYYLLVRPRWRQRRWRREGRCGCCGYDLRGTWSGSCSECGTAARELPYGVP